MADLPGRSAFEPADREDDSRADGPGDDGWGSPLPAEYGSLQAVRPPGGGTGARGGRRVDRARAGDGSPMSALLRRIQGGGEPVPATADGPALDGAAPATADRPTERSEPIRRSAPAVPPAGRRLDRTAPGLPPGPVAPVGPKRAGAGPVRQSRRDRSAARRAAQVRSRATIRRVDVWTVAKVSIIFYLIVLLVVVVASVLLWYAADAFGTLSSFEKSIRTLFSLKSFTVHPGTVAFYTAAVGAVIAIAGTIANILLAFIYNLISDLVGGVRVEIDSYPGD
jgi:hypothetical protein